MNGELWYTCDCVQIKRTIVKQLQIQFRDPSNKQAKKFALLRSNLRLTGRSSSKYSGWISSTHLLSMPSSFALGCTFMLQKASRRYNLELKILLSQTFSLYRINPRGGFQKPIYALRQTLTLCAKLLRLKKLLKSSAQSIKWLWAQLLAFMKSTPGQSS